MSLEDLGGITPRKGSPLDPQGTRDLEEALIKAAKAFREAWLLEHDTEEQRRMALLLEAIEDLVTAEEMGR